MRHHSLCLIVTLFYIAAAGATVGAAGSPPNILYFYVDDMGWGSIGPNGQAERRATGLPSVRTPNLDRLAAEGVNFTRGYGCHVCSPARSSQQSGFHQGHTFADRNDPNNAKKAMRADDVLMGDVLSKAGYATGYWGKWGYGGSKDQANPKIENVQTLPTSHGYQSVLAELHHVRAHTFFQPTLWSEPTAKDFAGPMQLVPNSLVRYQNNSKYPNTPALQNHPNYPSTAYCDDSYAFAALDFVRNQGRLYRTTGKPFFGLLAVQIPHAPFKEIATLPEWDRAYQNDPQFKKLSPQAQQWAAMVTRIDAHFGNILAALEDPNGDGDPSDSIADNTLVIFQSDNGGPKGNNNVELNANGGLRGNKGMIQEGGIRVPLIMRWPAKIDDKSKLKAGENCDKVVDVTDLLPTFCQLAGAPAPLGVDGVSIAPTLTGEGTQRERDFIIHEASNGQALTTSQYKLIRGKKGDLSLYDLRADPTESHDISSEQSDLAKAMETQLLAERVTEPKGFANTYHRWTGEDGDSTADADHWSDYRYANAGVTYLADDGAPRDSWIAHIVNDSNPQSVAKVARDMHVLALEVGGNNGGEQIVRVEPRVTLTGRNEIRLSPYGTLTLQGATVASLRWIDVRRNAALTGSGQIRADVYNAGTVAANGQTALAIAGDYHQTDHGRLMISGDFQSAVKIQGAAHLAGRLEIDPKIKPSKIHRSAGTITVLQASEIRGRFKNDTVVLSDGSRWKVEYSDAANPAAVSKVALVPQ